LREGVEALLAAHERLEGTRLTAGGLPRVGPGSVVGPYKLLQQIGEGGMGTVFMADQTEPVQRRVALKVVKPGMDSRQVVARFEAERQALALMDHPNIAKVLGAGTTDAGYPYFVMELVHGVPITRYCDEHRLTPRQRLELFVPVCQAVQHAHSKGVIHRDLKPSNILVALYDGRPVPKVIDFGVAKATGPKLTERTLFTEFGAVLGTLEYMSPEQAEMNQLDIDTRSDVYSLGVLLYELLTGTTPLQKGRLKAMAILEVLRLIREEEPPRPSTRLSTTAELPAIAANRGLAPRQLGGVVRGELDWIVMKCLEKDRNRRYQTANDLAADIERYLRDEAVHACPPSALYRFRKLARRNRPAFAVAAVVVLALAAVLVTLGVNNVLLSRSREALRQERNTARLAAARAELINKFVTQLLTQIAPDKTAREKKLTAEELFHKAAVQIAADPQFGERPEVEGALRLVIGKTYYKLGVPAEAEKHLRRAAELSRGALGPEHPDTLAAQEALAWLLIESLRQPGKAEHLARQTWEARGRALGPEHPDTLDSMDTYACALVYLGRLDVAGRLLGECWEARRRVLGPEHEQTLTSQGNLGSLLNEQGRWEEAQPLLRGLLETYRRQRRLDMVGGLSTTNNLALALLMSDKAREAEPLLHEALEASGPRYGPKHPYTLHLRHMLTRALFEQGRYEEARSEGRKTLELRREAFTAGPEHIGRSLLVLGAVEVQAGRAAAAEPLLEEALSVFRKATPAKDDLVGEAENWLGACLAARGLREKAEPLLTGGYEKLAAARGVGPAQLKRALDHVVRLYEGWGKPEQAARWRARQPVPAPGGGQQPGR
jgi:non-specific serine/threonine protein kinase/serine/threonine-protein kinase